MVKQFFFFVLLICFSANYAAAQPGNPCDPATVAQVQADLIAQGFDCLQGAGPFACIDDVFNYAFEHCPPVIDTTGGNPCDPATVAQVQADLIAQGFDCLNGAGPFTCVDEVIQYALDNCPLPIDTTGGNPCDPAVVGQLQADLIAQGFDCLIGAGPFTCVDEVFNYAFENCPPPIDTTGGNSCDPVVVNQCQNDLIAQGFDCLAGAGPFNCLDELFDYAFTTCPPVDSTGGGNPCDSAFVEQVQEDLIAQGFDCLLGAGPFTCVDEVFNYAFENCPPPIDTTGGDPCDSTAVQQTIDDMIAQGYDCLVGAGPFYCVHEVVCYALNNCPTPIDTSNYNTPACLENVPASVTTFQQFLQYMLANCDSTVTAGIPACWLSAPTFGTDDEFIAWITANCDLDSLVAGGSSNLTQAYFSSAATATHDIKTSFKMMLSPNPATSAFEVRLKDAEISRVELFDINGRSVLAQDNVGSKQTSMNISKLPAGMYMLRVQNADNATATRRIVKE